MTDDGRPVPFRYVCRSRISSHVLGVIKGHAHCYLVICRPEIARTMRGKPYCCNASRHMYEDYYFRQVGGLMPVFVGSRHQRGHGLESVLEGIFRRFVIPLFKTHALARDALKGHTVSVMRTISPFVIFAVFDVQVLKCCR